MKKLSKNDISVIELILKNGNNFNETNGFISYKCDISIRSITRIMGELLDRSIVIKKIVPLSEVDNEIYSIWKHSRTKEARFLSVNKDKYNEIVDKYKRLPNNNRVITKDKVSKLEDEINILKQKLAKYEK